MTTMHEEVPLLPGYSEGTVQWKAEALQMINWGGFHGYHQVQFAPGSTLISGASGTGKSTLLDAYTAIMMPSKVPFNGASNDATRGRARSADQRNVLTYLRGKRDTSRDGDVITDQVLRGDGEATWGILAMTFVNDLDTRFTCLRTYFASASCRSGSEVTQKFFTLNGQLDLHDLAALAETHFDLRVVRGRFPSLVHVDGVGRFIETVTQRLGIGANGNGEKALLLLARIQAGHQVRTVDRLYKELVLERPPTYQKADDALEHFESLNQSYAELETSGEKEALLHDIADLHRDYENARDRADRLDRLGVTRGRDTVFGLWRVQTLSRLLDDAHEANRVASATNAVRHAAARDEVRRLKEELSQIEQQQRDNGGGALEAIAVQIEQAKDAKEKVDRARLDLVKRTGVLHLELPNEEALVAAKNAAHEFLNTVEARRDEIGTRRDGLLLRRVDLERRLGELGEEQDSLKNRQGRVPMRYDTVRNTIAEACGLRPHDLPFAAELMDVDSDYEEWRLAAELTLRGVGLTLLMDARRQRAIRERIENLSLSPRVNFEGVDLNRSVGEPSDDRYISGRLVFKDSPFTGWVMERVQARGIDHLCVDAPSELGGDEAKVTIHGQVSRGRRGAHGHDERQRFILGFSNESRRCEIEDESRQVLSELNCLGAEMTSLESGLSALDSRKAAYDEVLRVEWPTIDIDSVEARIAGLEEERVRLLANSDVLARLNRRHDTVSSQLDGANREMYGRETEKERLEEERDRVAGLQAASSEEVEAIERSGLVVLEDADERYLSEQFRELQGSVAYEAFEGAADRFRNHLVDESGQQRRVAEGHKARLQGIFHDYNRRWPDPNRGEGVESYPDFAAIHEEIVKHGLFERREEWKRRLQIWSGNDLMMLNSAFDDATDDIEDRLDPVNEILRQLPFGAEQDRLRIDMRRLVPAKVTSFRKQLRDLASNSASDWTTDQAEERFRSLRDFMARIDTATDGSASERDDLLDVRRHIEITATRVDAEGRERSTYSELGGKSGGESQELVAFIVGAALRFQLGDETRTMPRFAPVMLDEGFVKADGQFARRAVDAWRGLGFQLIIAAPLDKVTALEPYMDLNLAVTKDVRTGYSFVSPFYDAEEYREVTE